MESSDLYYMPLFKPGTQVRLDSRPETVSHVALTNHGLYVHLVGKDKPVESEALDVAPSAFYLGRMPERGQNLLPRPQHSGGGSKQLYSGASDAISASHMFGTLNDEPAPVKRAVRAVGASLAQPAITSRSDVEAQVLPAQEVESAASEGAAEGVAA